MRVFASMGPRLCRRGNRSTACAITRFIFWLQWGHAFADVETSRTGLSPQIPASLQWGHAFADVETSSIVAVPSLMAVLQWGHAFADVETKWQAK